MAWLRLAVFAGLALVLCGPSMAQTRKETLADIRQELSVLYVDIQRLKTELSTTGSTGSVGTAGDSTLQRIDALEGEVRRITGKVEEMDRVYKYSSLKMGWCLDCHWAVGEDTDVATDRLLIEQFPPPETPDERQPIGLYPRRLDQQYGANRGPIDCFACHY